MAFSDQVAGGWCADADGAGGFTNWRQVAGPADCVNATTGSGTWWFLPLSNAQGLQSYVVGLEGSGASGFTSQEVAALKYQAANPSPFNLSLEEGALIGSAVLAVWGLAAGLKAISRFLSGGFSEEV